MMVLTLWNPHCVNHAPEESAAGDNHCSRVAEGAYEGLQLFF